MDGRWQPTQFGKGFRRIVQSDDTERVVFIKRQRAEVCFAKTHRVRQHGLKYWIEFAART
jgi:hypothetical protein